MAATGGEDKKIIYSMYKVSRHHGTRQVLKDISLSYYYGAKIGVIGLNGSGKSTLLKILAGVDTEYSGEITMSQGLRIGYLPQEPQFPAEKTVKEIVAEAVQDLVDLLARYDKINESFGDPDADMDKLLEEQGAVQEQIEALDGWNLESRLEFAMDALRCPPPDQKIGTVSGGERRRVALCRLLLQKPDILLLDEPTNHLDAESIAWLERHLQEYEGTVIAVTHDRYFLDNVAGWILELDRGEGIPWKGNYSGWLEQKKNRLAQEEKSESERQRTLARELEWIRMSPKARHAKSKARIQNYENLLRQGGVQQQKELQLHFPPGPRLGKLVVEAVGLSKSYGEKLLFDDLNFQMPPGSVVGIVGPNGAGKTTLFKIITGEEQADAGTLRLGDTVKLGYADQMRADLDSEKTVWEQLSGGLDLIKLGDREINSRAYVSWFQFGGSDQQKKIGVLSGGERNRVNLAMMVKSGANLILLDEPTNDLDVNTMRALEEALDGFAGCALVVSHDRWFLDRICTHILAFEGNSKTFWFDGNYTEYEEHRRARLGADADRPHRIVYRSLTRD